MIDTYIFCHTKSTHVTLRSILHQLPFSCFVIRLLKVLLLIQGLQELEGLEQKAKASGACQLVVKDLKEEFVKDYIYPCLRAGAVYERKYLLGTSMARPVIAKVCLLARLVALVRYHRLFVNTYTKKFLYN